MSTVYVIDKIINDFQDLKSELLNMEYRICALEQEKNKNDTFLNDLEILIQRRKQP